MDVASADNIDVLRFAAVDRDIRWISGQGPAGVPYAVYSPPLRHGLDIRLIEHEHVIEVDHHIDAEDYLQIVEQP